MIVSEPADLADARFPDRAEIAEVFRPHVMERLAHDDPRWRTIRKETARQLRKQLLRRYTLGLLPGQTRSQSTVMAAYSQQWRDTPLAQQLAYTGNPGPCEWGEERYLAHAIGTKRVPLLMLMRTIEWLKPRNVLEVGAGNGLNLLVLAARFPDISFTGVELTASGVAAARSTAMHPLDPVIAAFSPEPPVDSAAVGSIAFSQEDCRKLPFEAGAFDLVFTNLALEQMEEIRHAALSEIARVSGRHVAMIEPFRDFNDQGIRRDYIRANKYFAGQVDDLPQYGLTPVHVTADMPHKITLKPGFVVAHKA